jgi:hypothetical protein
MHFLKTKYLKANNSPGKGSVNIVLLNLQSITTKVTKKLYV